MKKSLWIACWIFAMGVSVGWAQSEAFFYRRVLENDQVIGNNRMLSLLQDRNGFMWIGTGDGLAKYDGYQPIYFFHDPNDTASLSGNDVLDMLEDEEGYIWVCSGGKGIDCINPKTGKIVRNPPTDLGKNEAPFSSIREGLPGELLLTTRHGFFRFDKQARTYELLDSVPVYKCIIPYQDSLFLVSNSLGVKIYHPQTQTFSHFQRDGIDGQDSLLWYANDFLIDREGRMWFASPDYGVLRVNDALQQLEKFCGFDHKNCNNVMLASRVMEDGDGNIWVTGDKGLLKFDRKLGDFVPLTEAFSTQYSPLTNNQHCMLIDKDNNLWLGGENSLNITSLNHEKFHSFAFKKGDSLGIPNTAIYSLCLIDTTDLWAATYGGGILKAHLPSGKITRYFRKGEATKGELLTNNTLKITHVHDNTLWVGSAAGLFKGEMKGNEEVEFTYFRNEVNRGNYIFDIKERPDHTLLLGTIEGLFTFNPATDSFSHFPNPEILREVVFFIAQEEDILWVGTDGRGLVKYNVATQKYQNYVNDPQDPHTISINSVNHVLKDPGGWYWVSTTLGLNLFNPTTEAFESFSESAGIPHHYICATMLDGEDNIWVSTGKGTSKLTISRAADGRPSIGNIRNYTIEDGLGANGYNFGAYTQGKNGRMFFAGKGGITYFDPKEIAAESKPSKTVLSSFKVLNEPWEGDFQVPALKEVELDYFQNFFSFTFSAQNYLNPKDPQYAYKLEGLDEDWVFTDRQYSGYTKVKPGAYTFLAKSTNRNGEWGTPTSMKIVVRNPYWLSWWFLSMCAALIFGVGYLFFQLRIRQIASQRARKVAEQSAAHKAAFLANMSHEIRTPMNAVVGTMHLLGNTSLTPKQQRYVENVRQSAENLLVIVNDILDFSKIEAGKLTFIQKPFQIRETLDYVYQILSHRAAENETTLDVICEENVPKVLVGDATRLIQILLNLGSNAVKFTKEGKVSIRVTGLPEGTDRWWLTLAIEDTGIGISEEKLQTIFDSFVQGGSEITQQFGGTGLGLSIARRLVNDQGGNIQIESELNKGTTFTVKIPYQKGMELAAESREEKTTVLDVVPKKLKLLLAEDNQINREIAVEIIQEMIPFAQIETAENGKKVIDRLSQANRYDLILMDIKMPIMDGYTCAKVIREQFPPPINRIPIIALTATATDEEIQKCLEIGMNDFVPKPFDPEELKAKILKFGKNEV